MYPTDTPALQGSIENQSIFCPTNGGMDSEKKNQVSLLKVVIILYEWASLVSEVTVGIGILLNLYSFCSALFQKAK